MHTYKNILLKWLQHPHRDNFSSVWIHVSVYCKHRVCLPHCLWRWHRTTCHQKYSLKEMLYDCCFQGVSLSIVFFLCWMHVMLVLSVYRVRISDISTIHHASQQLHSIPEWHSCFLHSEYISHLEKVTTTLDTSWHQLCLCKGNSSNSNSTMLTFCSRLTNHYKSSCCVCKNCQRCRRYSQAWTSSRLQSLIWQRVQNVVSVTSGGRWRTQYWSFWVRSACFAEVSANQ